jgi:TRAP-type C4-dicarboxylate transport system substrate-binding protein
MKMKKLMVILLTIVATMSLVAGCTTEEPAAPQTVSTPELNNPALASPQPIVLKFVYWLPNLLTARQTWEAWAHDIEDATSGLVKIKFIDGVEIGESTDQYNSLLSGEVDIVCFYPELTSVDFPLSSISKLPLMFPSAEVAADALWQFHKKYTINTELKDIKLLAVNPTPPYYMFTNKTHVKTRNDLKGMRVASFSPAQTKILENLGAIPVPMPISEIFTSMTQGLVDGVTFPCKVAVSLGGMKLTTYRTAINLHIDTALVAMSRDSWDRLHPDIQNIITGATGALWSRYLGMANDREADMNLLALKEYDKQEGNPDIYWLSDEEREKWVTAVTPILDGWVQEMEAKGLPGKAALDDLKAWEAQYQEMSALQETTPPSDVFNWEEAYEHIGETWTVTGPIIDSVDLRIYNMGDVIVLGMGKSVSNRAEGIGIHLDVDDSLLPEDLYVGRTISVTGEISLNQFGGASMTVTDLSQIQMEE